MPRIERSEIVRRLRANIEKKIPIVGTGAGTGISAKFEEAGGTDLIIIYNSGKYRMAGRGSVSGLLAYGDANAIVMEMAGEVLPVVKDTPVLAGVNGTDPFKDMRYFLKQVKEIGFSGVQNFPTIGLFDGNCRLVFEETGMSYDKEVEMVAIAHEMDLLTTPYCFNTKETEKMVKAGADIIVAHAGCTVGGSIGAASAMTLEDAVKFVQEIRDAAYEANPEIMVICHGGPIAMPEDILQHTHGVHGFYGASSAERFPVEQSMPAHIRRFKEIRLS